MRALLIQNGVKLLRRFREDFNCLRALLIQNGVKPIFILLKFFKRLRTLVLWSDRDTYKFLIFKVFMMNDILFMTQYAL